MAVSRKTSAAKLAALDIRRVPIDDLKADPHNARTHNERNLTTIQASLARFGQRRPLVVDKNMTVVAGNGTLEVMRDRLEWTEVWVSIFPGTAAEARAFGIADNRTGELAGWDSELLAAALTKFDPELMAAAGFAPEEFDDLKQWLAPPAEIPEAGPWTKPGDDLTEHDERYAGKATWTLSYDYPNNQFAWLADRLAEYRTGHDLASNADALVAVVEEITGQMSPLRREPAPAPHLRRAKLSADPTDYQIAIPSAGRADTIMEQTMGLLIASNVDPARISVFVPDDSSAEAYRSVLPDSVTIRPGHGWGMRQARNAIARAYPAGTNLVQIDDDLTEIATTTDRKTLDPVKDIDALIRKGIETSDGHLWCLYPVPNPFFMRPGLTRRGGLWYAVGAWFGYRVTLDETELVELDDKEDFERSVRFYLRDGEVVRLDSYTYKTKFYGGTGGMQAYRTPETIEKGARALAERYPDLAHYRMAKSGRAEIKLLDKRAPKKPGPESIV